MSLEGTVKNFDEVKGFGFIVPDTGGEDHFIHIKQCNGEIKLSAGDRVRYDNEWNTLKGKAQGSNCTVIAKAAEKLPPGPPLQFGIRGDSLLRLRHEGGSKTAKRWRTFKAHFEAEFYAVFGNCLLDYELNVETENCRIRNIAHTIANGPAFDILCVGLGMQELLQFGKTWGVVPSYPGHLDQELEELASAIKAKSGGSLVFVGGPASFWKLPPHWDNYMERARNTLRKCGVAVVPIETAGAALEQMTLSGDCLHISNDEDQKEMFAKAWAAWLYATAADPTFGRTITDDKDGATSGRDRSRSPARAAWASFRSPC